LIHFCASFLTPFPSFCILPFFSCLNVSPIFEKKKA
jgi:hypothetical protein